MFKLDQNESSLNINPSQMIKKLKTMQRSYTIETTQVVDLFDSILKFKKTGNNHKNEIQLQNRNYLSSIKRQKNPAPKTEKKPVQPIEQKSHWSIKRYIFYRIVGVPNHFYIEKDKLNDENTNKPIFDSRESFKFK